MKTSKAKSIVKWAGGKQRVVSTLKTFYPKLLQEKKINRYVEPFLGGGSVLLDILQTYEIEEVFVGDMNSNLILTYEVVKERVSALINQLEAYQNTYVPMDDTQREIFYYRERAKFNELSFKQYLSSNEELEQASRFLFLNKTCFNGLYRENKSGEFNVPIGRYKKPRILDKENLLQVSQLLKKVNFFSGEYHNLAEMIDDETFVYLDPPYRPISITSNYTGYAPYKFDDENQRDLSEFYKDMSERGAYLMLSNSDTKDNFFGELYKNFNINRIQTNRTINSDASKRGRVSELVITNY